MYSAVMVAAMRTFPMIRCIRRLLQIYLDLYRLQRDRNHTQRIGGEVHSLKKIAGVFLPNIMTSPRT